MMRSMFSGVAGLRNHQFRMDVIGNNIANVNTVGFKKSKVTFQDMLSQNIRGASSPQGGKGGTNPQQVGLGMTVGSIDTIHTQGSSEMTGKTTDVMVNGDGFFVVANGTNNFYTRAGNFDFDTAGNLVNPNGLKVQGWTANAATGVIDTTQPLGGITIPRGMSLQPKATTTATYANNLDANAAAGTVVSTSLEVFDSQGRSYNVPINFTKDLAGNQWAVDVPAVPAGMTGAAVTAGGPITFNGAGAYTGGSPVTVQVTYAAGGPTTPQNIVIDMTSLTQFATTSNAAPRIQNGYSSGSLTGYSIDKSGMITGLFSNGQTQQLSQIALANFNNPGGLVKSGDNLYVSTNNSGTPQIGVAGSSGRGDISPGTLEMSNVDLSQEFTDMIITQRGFQANSRIITTSDEMLQELVNLKR